ncbi:hypothetical protein PAXINDRAFT_19955 [Paxillus involutus ATCC 200175]|uniref:Uncharacterized protein n=1 Tax=Paxillus involutus ATCC 200175 TaxID=664439 RepID=A0A0C9T6B4_PAXIN|nr:hypothetical protein PAXINDRAFT_19955 [Paxillus involutus ATCC 200175]
MFTVCKPQNFIEFLPINSWQDPPESPHPRSSWELAAATQSRFNINTVPVSFH